MNINRIDLNLLITLEALIAERSVGRAALRLHLSQPAVSNALARLRRAFGDPLLIKTGRGMTPTPRALELAMPIRDALARIERSLSAKIFDPQSAAETITIGATDYVEFVLLPRLLSVVRQEAPNLRISVLSLSETNLQEALDSGRMDLAIGYFPSASGNMHLKRIFDEKYVCVVRKDYLGFKRRLTLKEFADASHLVVSPQGGGFIGPVDTALARHGLKRRVAVSIPHFMTVPHVIAQSDLVVTLTERVAREFCALMPLKMFKPPVAVPGFGISALWHERTHNDLANRWLRERVIRLGAEL